VWYAPSFARWRLERGARALVDGAAIADVPVGSLDWLASEILGARGEAVVLEPPELRGHVAERARALLDQLALEKAPA
jgi:predicted DNA-binding transcriptional regulator YafY